MKKLFILLVWINFICIAKAQDGDIRGRVGDQQTGLAVQSAFVMIVDDHGMATGKSTKTDKEGNYKITSLATGTYNLEFSHIGYTSTTIKDIQVTADKPTALSAMLNPNGKKKK